MKRINITIDYFTEVNLQLLEKKYQESRSELIRNLVNQAASEMLKKKGKK